MNNAPLAGTLARLTEANIPATREALGLSADPSLSALPMAGSDRYYWRVRLPNGTTCVLSQHEGKRPENARFVPLARFLGQHGVRVPIILAEDHANHRIWLEDLGDTSLESLASSGHPACQAGYLATIAALAKLHAISQDQAMALEPRLQPAFTSSLYRWEQDYFWDHYGARHSGLTPDHIGELRRHPALLELAEDLAGHPRCLVHRDCQSQNILIQADGGAALIDFQGMRYGLAEYDLASLFYDPYVALPESQRDALFAEYHRLRQSDRTVSQRLLAGCAIQRLMQALGAYANLADNLGKSWYLKFIPIATERLRRIVATHPVAAALLPALPEADTAPSTL